MVNFLSISFVTNNKRLKACFPNCQTKYSTLLLFFIYI